MRATAFGMLVAGLAMTPALAKVELAKPDMRAGPEATPPVLDAEMPCMRVPPGAVWREWVTSTIRADDGTILAVGSTEIRQRC